MKKLTSLMMAIPLGISIVFAAAFAYGARTIVVPQDFVTLRDAVDDSGLFEEVPASMDFTEKEKKWNRRSFD